VAQNRGAQGETSGTQGPDKPALIEVCVFIRRRCPSVADAQCADKPVTRKGCFFSFAAGARRSLVRSVRTSRSLVKVVSSPSPPALVAGK
jgi:hypothetical protein